MSKKKLKGIVVSAKMDKTVVVAVETHKKHSVYQKAIKNTQRYKARDDLGVKEGNIVTIEECRPLSKEVRWVVLENLSEEK